jgi:hypothetical protein
MHGEGHQPIFSIFRVQHLLFTFYKPNWMMSDNCRQTLNERLDLSKSFCPRKDYSDLAGSAGMARSDYAAEYNGQSRFLVVANG